MKVLKNHFGKDSNNENSQNGSRIRVKEKSWNWKVGINTLSTDLDPACF